MRAQWLLLLTLASSTAPALAQSLKKVAAIDLPGPKGERFDYLTVDEEHQYLLSAHPSTETGDGASGARCIEGHQ